MQLTYLCQAEANRPDLALQLDVLLIRHGRHFVDPPLSIIPFLSAVWEREVAILAKVRLILLLLVLVVLFGELIKLLVLFVDVQGGLGLRYVELTQKGLDDEIDNVCETAHTSQIPLETLDTLTQDVCHYIVRGCVVAREAEHLQPCQYVITSENLHITNLVVNSKVMQDLHEGLRKAFARMRLIGTRQEMASEVSVS